PNSPIYEAAAAPLRTAPSGEYRFTSAVLGDVLQLLADEAGISFFSLPADSEEGQRIVTFTIHSSPFLAIETLAKANGIALIYENGIWYLRPENDTHLIGRTYHIKYNSRELVKTTSSGGNLGQVSSSGGGGTSTTSSGVDLQGTTSSFEVEESKLLEDIRELLDINKSITPLLVGSTSVDSINAGLGGAGAIAIPATSLAPTLTSEEEDDLEGKVIWNSDANTLYVVATRQQHQWIEGYLAASDQPQDQIAIEVKFFETSRDPRKEFGLDWSGTLAGGYNITAIGDDGGTPASSDGLLKGFANFDTGDYLLPQTAILDFDQVNVRLRALAQDDETRSVSYPRMVTTNNREVVLRSVVNQPVLAGTSSSSLGAGSTTSESITYLPIGTVLNILPKRLGNGRIQLNVALTISSIIGTEVINGNPFPIATSRVYNAPIEIDPSYTAAIGGLDQANWQTSTAGVAGLRKVPILGQAFRDRISSRERSNLLILITPSVIDLKNGGLPDKPHSVIRHKPNHPHPPVIYEDGTLFQSMGGIDQMFVNLAYEVKILQTMVSEKSVETEDKDRINELHHAILASRAKLAYWVQEGAESQESVAYQDGRFAVAGDQVQAMRKKVRWFQF
ncbi:MAG: hypothetical protein AAGJ31_10025, partial [Verrucomicrobiota bacterium]